MALNYQALPIEVESVSNVTATNSVDLGTVRVYNGEEYVYVYNAGPQSITVGQCAFMSANSGFSVTVTATVDGGDFPIGFVKHTAIGTGAYGWLITRGFTSVQNGMTSTAITIGDLLIPAAAGAVRKQPAVGLGTSLSQTTVFFAPYIGTVVSGCASGGTGSSVGVAYVRCFGS